MAQIHFIKSYPSIHLQSGTNLMDALIQSGLPVASSCRGDGICGKCKVRILKGPDNLSPMEELEMQTQEKQGVESQHRLSCQAQVLEDITIDTDYW